jgi:cytochrome c oxidase assembly protein subunit 11
MRGGKVMTAAAAVAVVAAMGGLVAEAVPLYRLFCGATGAAGTPQKATAAPGAEGRTVTVRFDTSVGRDMPWRFVPRQQQIRVHLGEQALAVFTATNLSAHAVSGHATFNVTPYKVGQYFDKIQCFCFQEQHLAAGQTVDMPVVFFVDPALAADPHANEVDTITLSYTFFRANPKGPS